LASHQESNNLFKSGLFFAAYWYFWFRKGDDQEDRRRSILTILMATLAGLVFARLLASALPFRVRPLYDTSLLRYPLSIPSSTNFMDWSSFPSDHAAYLAALGFGLICLSRRLTIPVSLYVAGWVCLPRLYLGIHYLSDCVVGAAIGAATVWATLRVDWIQSRVSGPLLTTAHLKPHVFYPVAYLVVFEMTAIFWDIREPVHAFLHSASSGPHHKAIDSIVLLAGLLAVELQPIA
jgi:undecaprenyl-diphosphatase